MDKKTILPEDVERRELEDCSSKSQAEQQNEISLPRKLSEDLSDYSWGVFWAVMVSMCVVMEGYDLVLIQNFYAFDPFTKKYGTCSLDNKGIENCDLSAAWQSFVAVTPPLGCFVGGAVVGWLVDKWGKKKVLLGCLVWLACWINGTFFAPSALILGVAEFFSGLALGGFAVIAPAYASEMLPRQLSPYLTSYTNAVCSHIKFSLRPDC
jgi:SP family general alpha glucoside:H+ symporter-like MFS transporter